MGNGRKSVALVLALMAASLIQGSTANGLCGISSDDLMECKPAVTPPSPVDPTDKCCAALETADLPCLCGYRNSMELPLLGIDPSLAMGLPAKCGLATPVGCR